MKHPSNRVDPTKLLQLNLSQIGSGNDARDLQTFGEQLRFGDFSQLDRADLVHILNLSQLYSQHLAQQAQIGGNDTALTNAKRELEYYRNLANQNKDASPSPAFVRQMQATKQANEELRNENYELKRKLGFADPPKAISVSSVISRLSTVPDRGYVDHEEGVPYIRVYNRSLVKTEEPIQMSGNRASQRVVYTTVENQ